MALDRGRIQGFGNPAFESPETGGNEWFWSKVSYVVDSVNSEVEDIRLDMKDLVSDMQSVLPTDLVAGFQSAWPLGNMFAACHAPTVAPETHFVESMSATPEETAGDRFYMDESSKSGVRKSTASSSTFGSYSDLADTEATPSAGRPGSDDEEEPRQAPAASAEPEETKEVPLTSGPSPVEDLLDFGQNDLLDFDAVAPSASAAQAAPTAVAAPDAFDPLSIDALGNEGVAQPTAQAQRAAEVAPHGCAGQLASEPASLID